MNRTTYPTIIDTRSIIWATTRRVRNAFFVFGLAVEPIARFEKHAARRKWFTRPNPSSKQRAKWTGRFRVRNKHCRYPNTRPTSDVRRRFFFSFSFRGIFKPRYLRKKLSKRWNNDTETNDSRDDCTNVPYRKRLTRQLKINLPTRHSIYIWFQKRSTLCHRWIRTLFRPNLKLISPEVQFFLNYVYYVCRVTIYAGNSERVPDRRTRWTK